ncbi:MAG: hypothetical protein FJ027_20120 [Candidatus Rokubacteria bacterium]|nr:hypothetical protein [Candidatus Rokubacteria bacterium]
MDDVKVLLGRVAGGLEGVVREQQRFREETKTEIRALTTKLDGHAGELAEHRGARRRANRRTAVIATVAAALVAAVGHIIGAVGKVVAAALSAAPGH